MITSPLARQRSLSAWVAAIEQQSRVWLPLRLGGPNLSDTTLVAFLGGMSTLVLLATMLMIFDVSVPHIWTIFWSVGAASVVGVTIALRRAHRRNRSRGWILDFRNRTLMPVGFSRRNAIELQEECCVSWKFFDTADDSTFACRLILHLGPGGTEVPLTCVTVRRGEVREQASIDECLIVLSRRLGSEGLKPTQGGR